MKNSMIFKLKTYAAAITVIATAAGFYSCADDLPSEGNTPGQLQQKMSFSVTTNDYLKTTRAVPAQLIGNMVCSDGDDPISVTEVIDNSITGDAPVPAADKATRGIPVENKDFPTTTGYNGFKMMAAIYDDDLTWLTAKATTVATNFMDKENVLGDNDFETQYIWPGTSAGKKVAFFAWAPYTNTEFNTSLTTASPDLTVANEQGTPQLTYTVPTDNVSKQFDLITATAVDVPGDHNNIQQLHFNHVLSCIKFAAGDLRDCKITDIKLTNIHYRGTYTFSDETGGMGTWQNTDDLKTICIGQGETPAADVQSQVVGQERNFVLNADDKNLMMLPQTLEQGAQLQVSFVFNSVDMNEQKTDVYGAQISGTNNKIGTVSRTYTIDLSGRVWESGKTYTYILSTHSVNKILLVERPKNFAYDGTTTDATFRVSSYKYVNGGQTEPLPWTVKYYAVESDGAMGAKIDKPSWIESTTDAATNTTGGYQPYAMKLVAQQMTATGGAVSAITALQNAESIGTEDAPIDLSLRDVMGNALPNGRSTANCYVVRQPGWYSIPLAYGNGIKDGEDNPVALSAAHRWNSYGAIITHGYIYDCKDDNNDDIVINSAGLLWQDAPQLITPASIQLDEDHHNIKFQIEQRHITQGNAVLAAYDASGAILWSWHIWVTAQDFSDETGLVTIPTGNTGSGMTEATFMPVPLGHCDGVKMEYKERSFFVEVTQTETGMTATFKVTQTSKDASVVPANHYFYQFGRKDPLRSFIANGNTSYKPWYDNTKTTSFDVNATTSIKNTIKEPTIIWLGAQNWADDTYYDLWDVGSTSSIAVGNFSYTKTKKTIYDPSPVNFVIPCNGAYKGVAGLTKTAVSADNNSGQIAGLKHTVNETTYLFIPYQGYWLTTNATNLTQYGARFGCVCSNLVTQSNAVYSCMYDSNNPNGSVAWSQVHARTVFSVKE